MARAIALTIVLAFAIAALAIPARPTPLLVEDVRPANLADVAQTPPAQPQLCPSPWPICDGKLCPKPRSIA